MSGAPPNPPEGPGAPSSTGRSWGVLAIPVLAFKAVRTLIAKQRKGTLQVVGFSKFIEDAQQGRLAQVLLGPEHFEIVGKSGEMYRTHVIPYLDRQWIVEMLTSNKVSFGALTPGWGRRLGTIVLAVFPFLYVALVWRVVNKMYNPQDSVGRQHRGKSGGGRRRVTFADVAGVDAAKLELVEVVDILRDRRRYVAIGARLPKGILLSGPSGTGKTLLARAVACEAGVPFFSASASEFVEMLVGRGAARVRDLFERARVNAPCIIFIDELDALAKTRGGLSSNDEREQTLNQLLTEMDGFDSSESSIVVIAATNRPEVLDSALTRPGRFCRHVHVGLPDTRGRKAILEVHSRGIRLAYGVDLSRLAQQSRGFSGADLANLVNEAALLAVRSGATLVSQECFEAAMERTRRARTLSASGFSPVFTPT